jgi:hypothetical protein
VPHVAASAASAGRIVIGMRPSLSYTSAKHGVNSLKREGFQAGDQRFASVRRASSLPAIEEQRANIVAILRATANTGSCCRRLVRFDHDTRGGSFDHLVCSRGTRSAPVFLTSAAKRGASIFKMMDQSRHRSVETLRGYVRDAEILKEHAGAGLWCSRFSIVPRNRLSKAIQSGCCYAALTNAIYEYTVRTKMPSNG